MSKPSTVLKLFLGDCCEVMSKLPEKCVDLVVADLPYQRTRNKWDVVISFDGLWTGLLRVAKPTAPILLFADGMFMADLMKSQPKLWRYNLVWDKVLPSGFLNANRQPLRRHEEICVFYQKPPVYHPPLTEGPKNHSAGKSKGNCGGNNYNAVGRREPKKDGMKYPGSILAFQKPHPSVSVHPTQKPVNLLEWIIESYSNEGDCVLDCCAGSGSTGVACVNLNRSFIGIEKDPNYYAVMKRRIEGSDHR